MVKEFNMKQILISFLAALLVGSCATTSPKTQMTFMDIKAFDTDLSASMSASTDPITVAVTGGITVNNMPERLGNWLSVVDIELNPKTKSLAWAQLFEGLLEISEWLKEKLLYGQAGKYNATVFHDPETGKIHKVVFSRKDK